MIVDFADFLPDKATVNPLGQLYINGLSVLELANKWGTPLYIYDADTVKNQFFTLSQRLSEKCKSFGGEYEIAYAAKAYFSLPFARRLKEFHIGVDAVSLSELKFAQKAGFANNQVHLHGNNKTQQELELAIRWRIQSIVLDSLEEIDFVSHIAKKIGCQANVWLRVTPGLAVDTHPYRQTAHASSKFGFPLQDGQAREAVEKVRKTTALKLTGLHTHLGSQVFETQPYVKAIDMLLAFAAKENLCLDYLSPGGGWGVRYTHDDPDIDIQIWLDAICDSLYEGCKRYSIKLPRLIIEPGRWLVARSCIALYSVGTTKISADGNQIVALDGGMSDNPRPALYGAEYTAFLANNMTAAADSKVRLVGKYCESGDVLVENVSMPSVKRGDILVIPTAGAYQLSMASNYNLASRPAVLWVENGIVDVLQPREFPEEVTWWNGNNQG